MTERIQVTGGSDPLVTAAIIAAVARLEEERRVLASIPPQRPMQGRWVMSGRPRDIPPPVVRPLPVAGEWSVGSDDLELPET
jgi:hypothetical protein